MDIITLWNNLPADAKAVITGMAGKLAASMISAAGFQVKKRFDTPPKQEALDRAVSHALAATALAINDDPIHIDHTLTLLGEWLAIPDVVGELSRVIDPQPETELDTKALTTAFEDAGYDPETVGQGLSFAQLIAIFADTFYDAAAAEHELEGPIQIGLLRKLADHAKAGLLSDQRRTALQEQMLATLQQLVALRGDTFIVNVDTVQITPAVTGPDLDALEQRYLDGLYRECNGLPLVKVKDPSRQRPPRLQQVYVDLNTEDDPSLATLRARLDANDVDVAKLRTALQARTDDWRWAEGGMLNAELTSEEFVRTGRRRWDDPLEALPMLQPNNHTELERELELPAGLLTDVCAGEPVLATFQRQRQLVLLGDPGSGKSTLTRRLAGMMAALGHKTLRSKVSPEEMTWVQGVRDEYDCWLLPVRVVLSRWAHDLAKKTSDDQDNTNNVPDGCADNLIDECVRIIGKSGSLDIQKEHFLARLTAEPPTALLLLDGLDEVAAVHERERVVAAINHFATHYSHVPLLVTCRVRPYEEGEAYALDLPVAKLERLSRPAIDSFLQRWYAELVEANIYQPADKAAGARDDLRAELWGGARPELSDMAGGPLLLTMMAHVNFYHGLPENRAELYAEFIEQLLWEWDRIRQDGRGKVTGLELLLRDVGMEKTNLESALDELAYAVHGQARNERDTVNIRRSDLEDTLRAAHPGKDDVQKAAWAVRALKLIDERSGLIYARDPGKIYNFTHRTFQEYMAARYLATGSTSVILQQFEARIDDEQWREAIYLALGYQMQLRGDFDNAITVFAKLLPKDPQSIAAWRRVLLLGEAYVRLNGPQAVQQSRLLADWKEHVRDTVPRLLTAAMQNPDLPARQRLDAGLLVDKVGIDPPGLDDFLPLDGWFTTPDGDRFRVGRYSVTNEQYRRFVDAGGYALDNEERYWSAEGKKRKQREKWTESRYWDNGRFNKASQPVVGVSWYEADAYCVWLTARLRAEGVIGDNEEARLPTEAEWEAAARSSHGKEYPWDDDEFDPSRANTEESNLNQTTPVHMYQGGCTSDDVWDLSGNVWEWTSDLRDGRYPWLKGGSWYDQGARASASARHDLHFVFRYYGLGFRLVRHETAREN